MNQLTKMALEMGPLILFFGVNATTNLMTATAVFVAATVVALITSYVIARTIPVMPLIGGVFVIVFGGLTLYLDDDLFIKIKPTIVNLLFAAILFGGLMARKLFLWHGAGAGSDETSIAGRRRRFCGLVKTSATLIFKYKGQDHDPALCCIYRIYLR